jgi:hypothetical protein
MGPPVAGLFRPGLWVSSLSFFLRRKFTAYPF